MAKKNRSFFTYIFRDSVLQCWNKMQYVGGRIKDGSLDQGVDDSDGLAHPET
jgi:hypothetical protein